MTASRPLTPFRHSEGPLTTPELDRLERLLISPTFHEEAMPLDMLQGMLCAVASAPDLIPPSSWLPVALGDAPDYETKEEAEEILGLVMRFYGQIVQELESGGVTLYVFPDQEGENDLATWCEGYLEGVLLSEADWYEHGEPEQVEEMLLPFMLLSGRMREAAEEAGEAITPEEERGLRSSAAGSIGNSVMTMYSYWLNRRIFHAPARRDGRNVGRNDPCPCGSGKAYKSCHGSSATN